MARVRYIKRLKKSKVRLPCPFTPAVHKNITLLLIFMIELTTYVYFYFFLFSECGKKIVGVFSGVGHSTGEKAGPTEVDTYSRCWRNCLQLLGFWNFLGVFFRFFRLKLVYFWTESRKNIYGCFFPLNLCHWTKIWCQIWVQWHKLSGKNTHIYFFYFRFKNKRVWAEKIRKKQKNSKKMNMLLFRLEFLWNGRY